MAIGNMKKTKKKNQKTYIELANERAERQASHQQERDRLEREKFNHQRHKDRAASITGLIVVVPIFIVVIIAVVIWVKILLN